MTYYVARCCCAEFIYMATDAVHDDDEGAICRGGDHGTPSAMSHVTLVPGQLDV